MLKLENIKGGYLNNSEVLNGIDLELFKGEKHAIIGQNGAGKSSIIKAILNILPIISGEIIFKNENLLKTKSVHQSIGCFMQGGQVFPHLTIKENLLFSGRKLSNKNFNQKLHELQESFNILSHRELNRKAGYLSGGERHQLALSMVMINNPELLILDEPSAGLSPTNTHQLYAIIDKISQDNKVTVLLIEQNIKLAIDFVEKLSIVSNGCVVKELNVNDKTLSIINKTIFSQFEY